MCRRMALVVVVGMLVACGGTSGGSGDSGPRRTPRSGSPSGQQVDAAAIVGRLQSSGLPITNVEVYTAAKMLLPITAIGAATFFGGNLLVAILVGAVAGYLGPDLVIGRLIARRQTSITRTLPNALDLLVICMEAGLGLDQAMSRVADEIRSSSAPLAEELQVINREQRAGKLRLDAWRDMADRVDVAHVRQFVGMLAQTERFGTPIAHSLGQFADGLRMRRTQEAEEVAARTGAKLLFPLVFFIFPSIFVVTVGPAILSFQQLFQEMSK